MAFAKNSRYSNYWAEDEIQVKAVPLSEIKEEVTSIQKKTMPTLTQRQRDVLLGAFSALVVIGVVRLILK